MENIRTFVKTHPRRTMLIAGGVVLFLIIAYVVVMLLLSNSNKNTNNQIQIPVSYITPIVSIPVSNTNQPEPINNLPTDNSNPINPNTGTHRAYVSVPVTMVSCNINEKTYISKYFSFCYSDTYVAQNGAEGTQYVSVTNPADPNEAPYIVDLIDGNLAMSFHTFPAGYQGGYTDIDYVASAFRELDKQNATDMSFAQTGNYRGGTVDYLYTFKSPTLNTYASTQSWAFPDRERKTFILFHGDVDLMFVYEVNPVTQRMFDSIAFNQ